MRNSIMMGRLLPALGLIFLLVSSPSFADEGLTRGMGTATCGRWTEAHKKDDAVSFAFDQWLLGWVAGVAQFGNAAKILNGPDNSSLVAWVSNYCSAHPFDKVNVAAIKLLDALTDEFIKKNRRP